jgi:hypothetical protein
MVIFHQVTTEHQQVSQFTFTSESFSASPFGFILYSFFGAIILLPNLILPPILWHISVNLLLLYVYLSAYGQLRRLTNANIIYRNLFLFILFSPLFFISFFPPLKEIFVVALIVFGCQVISEAVKSHRFRLNHLILLLLTVFGLTVLRRGLVPFFFLVTSSMYSLYFTRIKTLLLLAIYALPFLFVANSLSGSEILDILNLFFYTPVYFNLQDSYNILESLLAASYALSHWSFLIFVCLLARSPSRSLLAILSLLFCYLFALSYINVDESVSSSASFTMVRIRFCIDILILLFMTHLKQPSPLSSVPR